MEIRIRVIYRKYVDNQQRRRTKIGQGGRIILGYARASCEARAKIPPPSDFFNNPQNPHFPSIGSDDPPPPPLGVKNVKN